MDHEEARELVPDFHDQELSGARQKEFLAHLSCCPDCRERLSNLDKISAALFPIITVPDTGAVFAGKVMRRIRAETDTVSVNPAWVWPALGFSFAALLLSLLPPAQASPAILLEELAGNTVVDIASQKQVGIAEEALRLVLEGK